MDDETIKIVRSYSQKVNMGNFESRDFFCTLSLILPADTDLLTQWHTSRDLHKQCMAMVVEAIEEDRKVGKDGYGEGISAKEFEEELDKLAHWLPGDVVRSQNMSLHQQNVMSILRKSKNRDKPKGITQGEDRKQKGGDLK